MEINFGIIAVSGLSEPLRIHHFCGYENKPTERDFSELRRELENDETFGLAGEMETIMLVEAPKEIVMRYRRLMTTMIAMREKF